MAELAKAQREVQHRDVPQERQREMDVVQNVVDKRDDERTCSMIRASNTEKKVMRCAVLFEFYDCFITIAQGRMPLSEVVAKHPATVRVTSPQAVRKR
jgi:hypothetical protein